MSTTNTSHKPGDPLTTTVAAAPKGLPAALQTKLTDVVCQVQSARKVQFVAGSVAVTFSMIWLLVMADISLELSSTLIRTLLSCVAIAVLAAAWRAVARKTRIEHSPLMDGACRIEQASPQLEERLVSAVEFSTQASAETNPSNGLIGVMIEEASQRVRGLDLQKVQIPTIANWMIAATIAVGAFMIVLLVNPEGTLCSLRNWSMPWRAPIFPMLKNQVSPGNASFIEGEQVVVSIADVSRGKTCYFEELRDGRVVRTEHMTTAEAGQPAVLIPDVANDVEYRIRIGARTTESFRITVLPIPKIRAITGELTFPEYTGLVSQSIQDFATPIKAVEGSTLALKVIAGENAALASLHWTRPASLPPINNQPVEPPDSTASETVFTFELPIKEHPQWQGQLNLTSPNNVGSPPVGLQIEAASDQPPSIEITEPQLNRIQAERQAAFEIRFRGADDFGVTAVALEVIPRHNGQELPQVIKPCQFEANQPGPLNQGESPQEISGSVTIDLSEIPEPCDNITLTLVVRDNRPADFGDIQINRSRSIEIVFQDNADTPLNQQLDADRKAIDEALNQVESQLEEANRRANEIRRDLADGESEPEALKELRDQVNQSAESMQQLAEALEQSKSDFQNESDRVREHLADEFAKTQQEATTLPLQDELEKKQENTAAVAEQTKASQEFFADLRRQIREKQAEQKLAADLESLADKQQKLAEAKESETQTPADQQAAEQEAWKERQQAVADKLKKLEEQTSDARQKSLLDKADAAEKLAEEIDDFRKQADPSQKTAKALEELRKKTEALTRQDENQPDELPMDRELKENAQEARDQLAKAEEQLQQEQQAEEQQGEEQQGEEQKAGEQKAGDQKAEEQKAGEQKAGEQKAGEQKAGEQKAGEQKAGEQKAGEQKAGDQKAEEQKAGEQKAGEQKAGEQKAGEQKAGEQKAGEQKAGEQKAGEQKAGEQKAGEQKAGEQKAGEQKDGEQKDGEQKDGEQKDGEQKAGEQKAGEQKAGEQKAGEQKAGEQKAGEQKAGEQKAGEQKAGEQKAGEQKAGEQKAGEQKAGEQKAREQKAGEQKAGEQKAGEQKAGEQKAGEQKAGEQKAGEQKDGEQKDGEQKAGEQKAGEQKAGEQKAGEQKDGEQKAGEQKAGEQKAGEQKAGEQKAGEQKAGEQKAGEQKAGEKKAGEQKAGEQKAKRTEFDESLRNASKALQSFCKSCRSCANCKNPGSGGGSGSGKSSSQASGPKKAEIAEAGQKAQQSAKAATPGEARQAARETADQLAELANRSAQQSGLRKPQSGTQPGESGQQPKGSESSVASDAPETTLQGGSSAAWTQSRTRHRTGVLKDREHVVPEQFKGVVENYFDELSKVSPESATERSKPEDQQ